MMQQQGTIIKQYRYRAKPWMMVLCILFFLACAGGLAQQASTNDKGAIIEHLIELNTSQATVFYWVLAAFSVGMVIIAFVGLVSAYSKPVFIELTENSITIPKHLWGQEQQIAFTDITDLAVQKVQRQVFLYIYHSTTQGAISHGTKKGTISRANMPSKAAFEELMGTLYAKVGRNI